MSVILRDYQEELVTKGLEVLNNLKILYLAAEVRTGKTFCSLEIANRYGANKVLFVTKKKAISSIQGDYDALSPNYDIVIINKESLHKVTDDDFDFVVLDENHTIGGSFPKPNNAAKAIKEKYSSLPMIFLSGTPAAESGSQWYHQFWMSKYSPFRQYKNFYAWAKDYTTPAIKHFGALQIKDYSKAIDVKINEKINPYLITITQQEAGFQTQISEKALYYELSPLVVKMRSKLLEYLVVEGKEETILADTAAKLMSKLHQIENGTIIFDSGNSMILDKSKAEFVKTYFSGKKLAMFYNFKKEYELIREVFGYENVTDKLDEFNNTDKHIALQQVSGCEGISLKAADCLVFYNWGYSGKNYIQARDRLTTIDRKENSVYFVMSKKSLTEKIYKTIIKKKRYSDKTFIKDFKLKDLFCIEN